MGMARTAGSVWVVGLVTVLSGCATTSSLQVTNFKTSLTDLGAGVASQSALGVTAARERFVEDLKAKANPQDGMAILDLQLEFEAPYGYAYPDGKEPLFATLERSQRGLTNLNRAMTDYATFLEQLTGDSTAGQAQQAQLNDMRTALNDTSGKAATDFDIQTKTGTAGAKVPFPTQLLSNAAMDIFEAVINGRRRRDLAAAVREVQPTMEAYSKQVRSALEQVAIEVRFDYDQKVRPLLLPPGDVEGLLELNAVTESRLRLLAALDESYRRLPAAHADLAASFERQATAQAGLDAFASETGRVKALAGALAPSD
jgi:hypothetical protein